MRILLVEDEKRMAQALCEILRLEKYEVDHYANGLDGLTAIESGIYDIVILDVMLPGMDGYQVTKQVRSKGITTPILMLTAKAELDDKVMGLDSGADDYLTKPFMTKELLARLRALGRRTLGTADGILSYGDISLYTATLTLSCTRNGQSVRLSEKEYRILEYFIANGGQILTREQLASKIWGFESDAEYNNVEVYINLPAEVIQLLFYPRFDFNRWLLIGEPVDVALQPIPFVYRIGSADGDRFNTFQIIDFAVFSEEKIGKLFFKINGTTHPRLLTIGDQGLGAHLMVAMNTEDRNVEII